MPANKGFGSTSIDFGGSMPKQRIITANINIFITKQGFTVIYFNKKDIQKAESFTDVESMLQFINAFVLSKGE